jgi:hypothetical protein
LVPVRNKNGEIWLRVDFCNLNRASDKDNYHVPPVEQILQDVSGSERLCLLDGLSGYNQVLAYQKMPFRLINVGSTFQREMDIDFHGLINQLVVIYLDNFIVFSKNKKYHLSHLRNQFLQ